MLLAGVNLTTTKKLPNSLTKSGRANQRGEHLVPCLDMPRKDLLLGVKTGRRYNRGYLVYTGVDVSVDDILTKLGMTDGVSDPDRKVIESFLSSLQDFKIGNLVSLKFISTEACKLIKESERPDTIHPKNKLPD